MIRHAVIFAACFLLGALIMVVVRTAGHEPYAATPDAHAGLAAPAPADAHAGHAGTPAAAPAPPAPAPAAAAAPVNTVCALCGMAVDPRIPTATWQGKAIGFGCKACPPRFAAEPEKYGPAALENRVVEE